MATEFQMPKLGLTMEAGTILQWLVDDMAMVGDGDPILVIETDKVESEVNASGAGVLKQTGEVGETYDCGVRIGWFLEPGEEPPVDTSGPADTESAAAPQRERSHGRGARGHPRRVCAQCVRPPAKVDDCSLHRTPSGWPPSSASTSRSSPGPARVGASSPRTSRPPPQRVQRSSAPQGWAERLHSCAPRAPDWHSPRSPPASSPTSSGSTWTRSLRSTVVHG